MFDLWHFEQGRLAIKRGTKNLFAKVRIKLLIFSVDIKFTVATKPEGAKSIAHKSPGENKAILQATQGKQEDKNPSAERSSGIYYPIWNCKRVRDKVLATVGCPLAQCFIQNTIVYAAGGGWESKQVQVAREVIVTGGQGAVPKGQRTLTGCTKCTKINLSSTLWCCFMTSRWDWLRFIQHISMQVASCKLHFEGGTWQAPKVFTMQMSRAISMQMCTNGNVVSPPPL